MAEFIKDSGLKILNMEKDTKNSAMDRFIREIMLKENLRGADDINGTMAKFTKDNGSMVWNTGLEFGEEQKEILILENGGREELMATEFTHGLMEIDIKENSRIA